MDSMDIFIILMVITNLFKNICIHLYDTISM